MEVGGKSNPFFHQMTAFTLLLQTTKGGMGGGRRRIFINVPVKNGENGLVAQWKFITPRKLSQHLRPHPTQIQRDFPQAAHLSLYRWGMRIIEYGYIIYCVLCIIYCLYKYDKWYYDQAQAGSKIFNPGISGTGFCIIPGSRDFLGRDWPEIFIPGFHQKSMGMGKSHKLYVSRWRISLLPSCIWRI